MLRPLLALATASAALVAAQNPAVPNILVFSKTLDYRHDSIPTAIDALRTMGTSSGVFNATFTEDDATFTSENLLQYAGIVFLSNSEGLAEGDPEVLSTESSKSAFLGWLQNGGALIGLHAGSACMFREPQFGVAMGSWFDYHPTISNATFTKVVSHPTVDMIPSSGYNSYEEVYSFMTDPRDVNATVLLTVDAASFADPEAGTRPYFQGTPHPIAWYRDSQVDLNNGTTNGSVPSIMPGRLWYTSLGHTNETWGTTIFLNHVQEGIRWALEGTVTNAPATSSAALSSRSSFLAHATGTSPSLSTTGGSETGTPATTATTTGSTPTGAAGRVKGEVGGGLVMLLLSAVAGVLL